MKRTVLVLVEMEIDASNDDDIREHVKEKLVDNVDGLIPSTFMGQITQIDPRIEIISFML